MSSVVRVRAPARLHFGMLSFGQSTGPQYGGVGMMVEPPDVKLTIRPAERFRIFGVLSSRAEQVTRSVCEYWGLNSPPPVEIAIDTAPNPHVGLGTGTQLSLAIASGLGRLLNRKELTANELSKCTGRGRRSAVGTHGFLKGGLIVDGGKEAPNQLGNLVKRQQVPADWRVVLVCTSGEAGLYGASEKKAFDQLPPVPAEITAHLARVVNSEMLPALEASDCDAFGEAVYQYGHLAGNCFAPVQGGPFALPAIAHLVESIRDHGPRGVGQSSWGPSVFAITCCQRQAESLVEWLREQLDVAPSEVTIAQPNNQGATIGDD